MAAFILLLLWAIPCRAERRFAAARSIAGARTTRCATFQMATFCFRTRMGSIAGAMERLKLYFKFQFPGMTMPDGRQARDGGWIIKGSADSFVTQVNMLDDQSVYVRYKNDAWEYVVSRTDRMPTGNSVSWVDYGNFDVSASGDVAFVYS